MLHRYWNLYKLCTEFFIKCTTNKFVKMIVYIDIKRYLGSLFTNTLHNFIFISFKGSVTYIDNIDMYPLSIFVSFGDINGEILFKKALIKSFCPAKLPVFSTTNLPTISLWLKKAWTWYDVVKGCLFLPKVLILIMFRVFWVFLFLFFLWHWTFWKRKCWQIL